MRRSGISSGLPAFGCTAVMASLAWCITATQLRADDAVATVSVQLSDPKEFDKLKDGKGLTLQLVRPKPVEVERDVLDICGECWNTYLEAVRKAQKMERTEPPPSICQAATQAVDSSAVTRTTYRKYMYGCLNPTLAQRAAPKAK
jgi:hypothetical protein